MIRATIGIPSCVWVINQHEEEITVVVSQYSPNHTLKGVNVEGSATGGGLGFEMTVCTATLNYFSRITDQGPQTFPSPATQKTLASRKCGRRASMTTFPLWTRKDGFGVISIFTGPRKVLYIENDRIPTGATAYFMNEPNLRLVSYHGKELTY